MEKSSRVIGVCLGITYCVGFGYIQSWAEQTDKPVSPPQIQKELRVERAAAPASPMSPRAMLDAYCVACHNAKVHTAGLSVEGFAPGQVGDRVDVWEKVARKLRSGEMPPPGLPRPSQAIYDDVATRLESALDTAAAQRPNPGRVAAHRLNRSEYTAAVRDILGVEIEPRSLLPADDQDQEGFDNVASRLSLSPALLENYLSAARKISRLAVGDVTLQPAVETVKISKMLVQDEQQLSDDLPFGSQGGTLVRHFFPVDAHYTIKVLLQRQEYDYLIGVGEPHEIEFRLDRALVKRFSVGGEANGMTMPESFAGNTQGDPEFEEYMHTADAPLELRIPVKAGLHEVGISFVRRFREPEGILQPRQRGFGRTTNEYYHGNPGVEFVFIGGPYDVTAPGNSASRRKVFTCLPKTAAEEEPCAKKILTGLATQAYRRPLSDVDIERLFGFYRTGRAERNFDMGIQSALEHILVAPGFLFRVEREPAGSSPGSVYRLSALELASRLSFFLWSSVPDEDLLNTAIRGRLNEPQVLDQQVRRMLRDARSEALVDNFATRWLELSKLPGLAPDSEIFFEFDENLRDSMIQETRAFVRSQLAQDRSVSDLLTADYSFLNERLAEHYGIPNIYGNHLRRVTFDDGVRGGLLAHGSLLTVTSYPNRTSVVMRGKWLLANILGSPPPPPPGDVPGLKEPGVNGAPRSLRERMEQHRNNPDCASCHQRMDPLGFALENFDPVGKWRSESEGAPIDPASSMPDGTKFSGVDGLRSLLGKRKSEFVRTFTEKMLAYATGRGIQYSDFAAIRKIERDAAPTNYRWSSIILGIANSAPFQMGMVGNSNRTGSVENGVTTKDGGK